LRAVVSISALSPARAVRVAKGGTFLLEQTVKDYEFEILITTRKHIKAYASCVEEAKDKALEVARSRMGDDFHSLQIIEVDEDAQK
jgi:hypothetical protein